MHHVRRWAHSTAHEAKFNPWHASPDAVKPSEQVTVRNRSPLSQSANDNAGADIEQAAIAQTSDTKPKIPIPRRIWLNIKRAIFHSWVNVLLIFVPAGIAVHFAGINPNVVFALNAIAIIPLAGLLTFATESVAHRLGPTLGALLNVSFGNAVELIIFIALVKNQIRIVQASLIGSILANLLLILGMAFLIGGLQYREQVYDSTVTQMSACLLALAVLSLLIPTAFHASFNDIQQADAAVLKVSRGTSVILLLTYILYLLFQLKSHSYLYQGIPQHVIDEQTQPGVLARFDSSTSSSSVASGSSIRSGSSASHHKVRRRLKSKLGMKRRTKVEVADEPTEVIENNEKGVFSESPIEYTTTDIRHASASEMDISKLNKNHIQRQNEDQEKNDRIIDLQAPRQRPIRPQIQTQFSTPVTRSNNDPATTNPTTAPVRPAAAFRALSSFRAPPVFRSATNPQFQYGQRSLPSSQLRRLASTPNTTQPNTELTTIAGINQSQRSNTDASGNTPEEGPALSQTASIILLLISTVLVALCAEFLVGSIEHLVESSPLSEAFIGLIILPIVGNAAEHVTAVTVAAKNKLDLSLGVSLGSSIQIALFVTPVVVILGWILEKDMGLYFNLFETASLFVSTFIVNFLVLDGRSNYLEGALLCVCYIILALAAFFFPDGNTQSSLTSGSGSRR